MNKQQSNKMASLRKKLLAAIAMLLVACIMTVSSTYAWFTLSTKPEVTGIANQVGANGNLEMALGAYDTFYGGVTPEAFVGSSFDATGNMTITNLTWGNLVDLTDASYGLETITMYPSRLNAAGNVLQLLNPLQYAEYGNDGRPVALKDQTMLGKYDATAGGFMGLGTPNYAGVNAVGSASEMSERDFAVRNGKSALESYRLDAVAAAKVAIRDYAGTLAALAIEYQNDDGTGVVAEADIAVLKSLIAKLQESNVAISDSLKSAILVVLASSSLGDDAWKIAVGAAEGKDVVEYVEYLQTNNASVSMPSEVTGKLANYTAINTTLGTALAALPESGDGVWSDIKDAVSSLLNSSGILICGYTINEIQASKNDPSITPNAFEEVTAAVMGSGLTFTFSETSGIFADIAEFTGNYAAPMTFPDGTTVEGINLGLLGAKTVTVLSPSTNKTSGDLGLASAFVNPLTAPGADPSAAKALTNTYGYTVDLLFRTNATDSWLQLQTAAANRYAEGASAETAGNGSNMTFTIDEEYSQAKIADLAEGIRVVFYDNHNLGTGTANILGVATLDVANGTVAGDAYKMDLKLTDYVIADNGMITINGFKSVDDTTTANDETVALCALTANEKKAISALVYLDGDVIDNSDAGLAANLVSVLNLQFSSSAELVPMEDANLMGN